MESQGHGKDTMEEAKRYEEEEIYYLKEWDDEDIQEGFKFALEINERTMLIHQQIEEQKGKLEPDEMEKFREELIKEQIEFVHNGLKAQNDIKKMKKSIEELKIYDGEK